MLQCLLSFQHLTKQVCFSVINFFLGLGIWYECLLLFFCFFVFNPIKFIGVTLVSKIMDFKCTFL